jgi:amino acid adenylation domain-containing protein/non-ribosomal peptide synthase protein (TIGR01720 family)
MKLDNVKDIYELSPLQEGILFHTLLTPGTGMYFEQVGLLLEGLDLRSFERAWQAVLDRHTILRTSFHWNDVDKPLQVVFENVQVPIEYLDWSGLPATEQVQHRDAFLIRDRERGFELSRAPLMRLTVIDQGRGARYVVFSLHHLLLDGWSSDLIYKEAAAFYEAYCRNERLDLPRPRPYGDYIAWLQQQDLSAAESYWRKRLTGCAGAPSLGIGVSPGPHHQHTEFDLAEARPPRSTTDALRQFARCNQLTLNTIVQGAWALLLSRYSGEDDVVFGATVSGRPAELQGIESMVGLFINTLPVRVSVSPFAALLPWLHALQVDQFEARRFEHTPLNQVHSWSDVPRETPLFETLVGFENFPAGGADHTTAASVFEFRSFGQTNYPITLGVLPGTDWLLKLLYARPRFERAEMDRMLGHFTQLLTAIPHNSARRLCDIPLLTSDEARRLAEWNETATSYPRDATIHQLFEDQERRAPHAIAVNGEGESLTYEAVNRRANQLGRRLRALGVEPETLVGLCVESPVAFVIGTLGVLKAGGGYVPLDPAYPDERLLYMLADSGAAALVTTRALAGRFPANDMALLVLEDLQPVDDDEYAQGNLPDRTTADNLAYVMYTSGSTGQPKGVAIPHRAVIRTVRDTNYIALGPAATIAQTSNYCFDAATFEVWGALLNGARLAGIPRAVTLSPGLLRSALRQERVTAAFVTTDLFNQLVREQPDIFTGIDNVLVGGSAIDVKWIAACLRDGRPHRLLHVYGPTESTAFASWHLITEAPERARTIPIGGPLANTELYVLDAGFSPVPEGVAGEIYIGGDGLARGYFNRPDLTAERFVPDPFSGRPGARLYRTGDKACRGSGGAIEFLGRFDAQVKIRGFRVELGEIESVLRAQQGVREAVVLAREDAPGSRRLAAYVVVANSDVNVADLRRTLGTKLPDYMVPSAFVVLDSMPLTPNGKIDRKALSAPAALAPGEPYTEPRSPAEMTLARIWSSVLAVERVGIHDNFFQLGGDSIISIQIIARAREAGLNLTLRQLFQNQTVAELAAVAGVEGVARAEQGRLEGEVPLMPIQHWFFEQQPIDAHHFNQAALMETPGGLDPRLLEQAAAHLLSHHDALRLRFRNEDGRWRQFYDAANVAPPFRAVDLRTAPEAEWRICIEAECEVAQKSLHLESGPIVRFVWFNLGDTPGRLLVVIHHLAVDSVSWRILMEDFWQAYERLARGEEVAPAAKTSSLRQWAARLVEHAQSANARDEVPYWTAANDGGGRVPLDLAGGDNLAANAATVTVELNADDTRALLQETPKAYQTQINDALLSALAQVLATWTRRSAVTFHLEGHGRETLFGDLDVTRTVGWFTTIFPVRLEVSSTDPGEALKAVKEQLRQTPNRGLTYGVLRYLASDSQTTASLMAQPDPDVSFNYLGQFATAPEVEAAGQERSVRARRPHLLAINAVVVGGRLRVHWEYGEKHHRRATIERLAGEFMAHLRDLIVHCGSPAHSAFTPSDFAQAGISQKDLDKLVATFTPSEGSAG